jgi:hypothetical protein
VGTAVINESRICEVSESRYTVKYDQVGILQGCYGDIVECSTSVCLLDYWPEDIMHPEGPAAGHLDIGFPLSLSKL